MSIGLIIKKTDFNFGVKLMASYVEKTLGNGEEVVYEAQFNWTYSFWSWVWFLISISPIAVLCYIQINYGVSFATMNIAWIFTAIAAAIGILYLLGHMITLWTTEIAVTTFRFVYKTGLISRDTKEVSLNKIEEITLNQSVWGRIFNYGGLTMRGTGVGVIQLPNIDDPIQVRRIIENAKSALRRGDSDDSDEI